MIKLWAALIVAGRRTIYQCPENLRTEVELLINTIISDAENKTPAEVE